MERKALTSLELCAGAGGQALGLEQAGFDHQGLVEIDPHCCATLRQNRPRWPVHETDLRDFVKGDAKKFKGIDLLAGGLPCPPFSVAGKQLGVRDERNLFPYALELIDLLQPRAIMLENVRGMLDAVFDDYRRRLRSKLKGMGYVADWHLLNASDYGVPQLRPRVVIVALKHEYSHLFSWPVPNTECAQTVGETLEDLMAAGGWRGASLWAKRADEIAPTVVGGSKKHGGPDLGPTRAKRAWADLGVDGMGIADEPPARSFAGKPKLTVRMVARLQGFPDNWEFVGRKTAAYRQVGNAFPPPVAKAVGLEIRSVLEQSIRAKAAA